MKFKLEYKRICLVIFFITSLPFISFTQELESASSFKSTPKIIKDPISNIRMGGYFRFLGYVRNFHNIYCTFEKHP